MADEPPNLTIAAENDPAEIEKREALDLLRWPTRELMANLLRVMRGAGRPTDLPDQVIGLALAIQEAGQHTNAWYLGQEIAEVLQSAMPRSLFAREQEAAENTIAKGTLQLLASNLLTQRAQSAAGSREMHDGVEELQRAWDRSRQKFWEEQTALKASLVKPRKRRKQRPAPKPQTITKKDEAPEPEPTGTVDFMRRRRRDLKGE